MNRIWAFGWQKVSDNQPEINRMPRQWWKYEVNARLYILNIIIISNMISNCFFAILLHNNHFQCQSMFRLYQHTSCPYHCHCCHHSNNDCNSHHNNLTTTTSSTTCLPEFPNMSYTRVMHCSTWHSSSYHNCYQEPWQDNNNWRGGHWWYVEQGFVHVLQPSSSSVRCSVCLNWCVHLVCYVHVAGLSVVDTQLGQIRSLGAATTTAGGIGTAQCCLDGSRLSSDTKTIIVALDLNQHSYVEAPEFDVQLPGVQHMAAMDIGLALPKHWSIRTSPYLFKKCWQ